MLVNLPGWDHRFCVCCSFSTRHRQTAWTVLEYWGMAALVRHLPMSFAPHRPVPLLVVVRRNRAANTDPMFFLVDSSANSHVRADHSHRSISNGRGRACRKDLLLALVELLSLPSATLLLKMMGHRRSSPIAEMVAKLEPPPRRFRRLE